MPLSAAERHIKFQHLSSDDVLETFCIAVAKQDTELMQDCAFECYARREIEIWDVKSGVNIALAGALIWYSPSAKSIADAVKCFPDPFREQLEGQISIFRETDCFPERSSLLDETVELLALGADLPLVREIFIFYRLRLALLRFDLDQCVDTISEIKKRYKESILRENCDVRIAALLWAALATNDSSAEIDFIVKLLGRLDGAIDINFHALLIDAFGSRFEDWRLFPVRVYELEQVWRRQPHVFRDCLYMVVEWKDNDTFFFLNRKLVDVFDFDFEVAPITVPETKLQIIDGESNSFLSHAQWCGTWRMRVWATNQIAITKSKWTA